MTTLAISVSKDLTIPSIWRPLFTPLEDWPLAVCDFRTTSQSSIVAADTVGRGEYKGESAYLKFDPAQEFWYLKHQTVDEVWLMKQFDSLSDATNHSSERVAQCMGHTLFRYLITHEIIQLPHIRLLMTQMQARTQDSERALNFACWFSMTEERIDDKGRYCCQVVSSFRVLM